MRRELNAKLGGDLLSNTDLFGSYITCFQCSRDLNEGEVTVLTARHTLKAQSRPAATQNFRSAA